MSKISMKMATGVAVIGGIVAGAVSASAALNLPTMSCGYSFNTNLKLNSRGTDVMNLQKVLNMYPQTQIATEGAGSPGMETTKFGPATRAAVNKFQALHLAELGITAPTGNVFAGTRALLNQVCAGGNTSTNTGNTGNTGTVVSGPVSVMMSSYQPSGMLASPSAAMALANITFTGNGTVTNIELQRIGLSNDSVLSNVYLYDGNTRITDAASVVTGGYIRFNAGSGLFTVAGSRTITVRADIASGASAQSVGVKVNSMTVMGGSAVSFSNVMGPVLSTSAVTPATVDFNAMVTSPLSPDAGVTNYAVWRGTANVGTRDVNFRAATFKFVGSAPVDSVANLALYVDGAKIAGPSMVNAANNNKVTFDLGNMPYLLKTGTHQIEVRGDIVKGSDRTMTFSIENNADLMLEDSGLSGVNISATRGAPTLLQNASYGTISVNAGSVVINQDPAFTANKVTGGATNMTIAQYTIKAFGEDVKVNSLTVLPVLSGMTPAASGLTNVGLYLNGGQIGSSQNWTSGNLTYNLGSSLIVPAGQTVTLAVKSDVKTTGGTSYSAGTVSANIVTGSNNANGVSSSRYFALPGSDKTGQTLTVSSGVGQFARTAGFTDQTVAPNTTGIKVGSFTIQAGSAEATVVNGATVDLVFSSSSLFGTSNVSNLTLKDGSTILGTPVGSVTSSNNFSFGDITVPMNSTKTFDVYADLGSYNGSETVKANMTLSTRGPVSGTTATPNATGVFVTATAATLAAPVLVSSSPVGQYVVGGSNMAIATFKLKTATGNSATVRQMNFAITGTDAIESVTVGGVTAPVVGTAVNVTGLNLAISSVGTDVPVTVKYAGFKNSTTGGSLTAGVATVALTVNYVEAISGTSVITNSTTAASNNMNLRASKPVLTVANTQGTGLGVGENKIGEVTVAADANGNIAVTSLDFTVTLSGITGSPTITGCKLTDGSTASAAGSSFSACSATSAIANFSGAGYDIPAGTSKTFSLYATLGGSPTLGSSGQSAISTKLTSGATFTWNDVIGNGTGLTGAAIYNFPTNSYTIKN